MTTFSTVVISAVLCAAPLLTCGQEEVLPTPFPSRSPIDLPCERPTDIHSIIGGNEIEKGSRPYLLSIGYSPGGKSFHTCGASLISPHAVMTAAHCVVGVNNGSPRWHPPEWVDFNRHALQDDTGVTRRILTDTHEFTGDVVYHPDFEPQTDTGGFDGDNDVAILFLTEPISDIAPISINFDPNILSEQCDALDIAGWGATQTKGQGSDVPLAVSLDYYPNAACVEEPFEWNRNTITENMLCAVAAGQATCQGDSGGPLVLGELEGGPLEPFLQVGIVSFGANAEAGGCENPRRPPVFTRVSRVACWVTSTVCERKGELCNNPCRPSSSSPSTLSPSITEMPNLSSHPSQPPSAGQSPTGSPILVSIMESRMESSMEPCMEPCMETHWQSLKTFNQKPIFVSNMESSMERGEYKSESSYNTHGITVKRADNFSST
ncbi:hypothetical protein ACHAW6_011914 [Cyclotella cf. meneghiniana]